PGAAVCTVIFADRAPRSFAEIRSPTFPMLRPPASFFEPLLFGGQLRFVICILYHCRIYLDSPQFGSPALGPRVCFFESATENGIDKFGIIDAVINLKSVLIHVCAAIRANHFGLGHFANS